MANCRFLPPLQNPRKLPENEWDSSRKFSLIETGSYVNVFNVDLTTTFYIFGGSQGEKGIREPFFPTGLNSFSFGGNFPRIDFHRPESLIRVTFLFSKSLHVLHHDLFYLQSYLLFLLGNLCF